MIRAEVNPSPTKIIAPVVGVVTVPISIFIDNYHFITVLVKEFNLQTPTEW